DWDAFARQLMQRLSSQFDAMGASVGHVKILVESGDKYIVANLTGKSATLTFRQSAGTSDGARLTLNARVEMTPETLEKIVNSTLQEISGTTVTQKVLAHRCLSPGRPNPTFKFAYVV
ncbi:MAG TPA: hypothetical protein PKO30_07585, partial [Prolixibacteraceae bacterium]|nr:hypothetical protein [Prolixibacteraceae bacterium]